MAFCQQQAIEPQGFGGDLAKGEAFKRDLSAAGAHLLPLGWVIDEVADGGGERGGISWRNDQPVAAVLDDFAAARGVGRYAGAGASGGFDQDFGHAFAIG